MCCGRGSANLPQTLSKLNYTQQIIEDKNKRMEISNTVVLSRDLFLKRDILTLLRFAYLVNPKKTIEVFKKYGIEIKTEKDLEGLAALYNTGKDKSGTLKNDKGEPFSFDVLAIASEISLCEVDTLKAINNKTLRFV